MNLHLTGSIDADKVDKLIIALNKHADEQSTQKITIYFKSDGGDVESMNAFIHLINQNASIIHMVAYGTIYSAAFFIFFGVRCQRTILPQTMGMCHHIRVGVEMADGISGYYLSDKANQDWINTQNKWTIDFCHQIGMSIKEINIIKKTQEVYFQADRLNELLEYNK